MNLAILSAAALLGVVAKITAYGALIMCAVYLRRISKSLSRRD